MDKLFEAINNKSYLPQSEQSSSSVKAEKDEQKKDEVSLEVSVRIYSKITVDLIDVRVTALIFRGELACQWLRLVKVVQVKFFFLKPNREDEREKKFTRRITHSPPQSSSRYSRDGRCVQFF